MRQTISALSERRKAPRVKSSVDSWADPGGVAPVIPCRVIDMSTTGAKIECADQDLPDHFILVLGASQHVVEVVWRRPNLVGVAFRKGVRPPAAGVSRAIASGP
jgi:hypothetical protein